MVGLVISGVTVEVLQFSTKSGVPHPVAQCRTKQDALIGTEVALKRITRTWFVTIGSSTSTCEGSEIRVDILVTHAGPIIVGPVHIQRFTKIHPQFAADIEPFGLHRKRQPEGGRCHD